MNSFGNDIVTTALSDSCLQVLFGTRFDATTRICRKLIHSYSEKIMYEPRPLSHAENKQAAEERYRIL